MIDEMEDQLCQLDNVNNMLQIMSPLVLEAMMTCDLESDNKRIKKLLAAQAELVDLATDKIDNIYNHLGKGHDSMLRLVAKHEIEREGLSSFNHKISS